MQPRPQVTRFAPSPTGALHLGNARTALLNDLLARSSGGRMVLRIEDTDAERSDEGRLEQLLADLRWFGLEWAEGPDVGGPNLPYRQSQRAAHYDRAAAELEARGLVYPCFCSPEALDLARRAQLAASRPPRYAGTCAALPPAEVARRVDGGARPAHRFRVPAGRVIAFDDLIHGPQRFSSDDIGDFVVRRADGSVAFFLGNALDDAAMAVTVVLRGDDHLANTPRQILLLEALGLPLPEYGHLPLLLGPGGAPLSKREGAASLHDLRHQGYLPGALRNYLVRLGHACVREGWLEPEDMAVDLDLGRSARSAPHFDEVQLRHWQREAVGRATEAELDAWLEPRIDRLGDRERRFAFVAAVRGNLLFPSDADALVAMVCDAQVEPDADAVREIASAGPAFFAQAAAASRAGVNDFKAWTRTVGSETGRRGARLFMPLRAALTGRIHGPELAPLAALMGPERIAERLRAAGEMAASA
jgi:glutamyl-tRNA synthetase